ncbi:MAG: ABC transporter ATP-binding protein [Planctomycetota bacterium]
MSRPIIEVDSLGKSYLLGHESASKEKYVALRDVVVRQIKSFGRKALDMVRGKQIIQGDEVEEFWALRNISFAVEPGEVVGVIGGNGAGKSTLLKILSRITEPTEGRVTLRGRVASLLEVGTGFHPELSGRENIYLNGAILGMTRWEVKRKFDEIVDFAEVAKFLDTPVKRYSSGMYVRLAFAVAAHLDPEILVVDEVLAVGDAQFQKKCLGKMQDVSKEQGRTVLFVSHNMPAIKALCTRAICLESGTLVADSSPDPVIGRYYHRGGTQGFDGKELEKRPRQYGTGEIRFLAINLIIDTSLPVRTTQTGDPILFELDIDVKTPVRDVFFLLVLTDLDGRPVSQLRFPDHTHNGLEFEPGRQSFRVSLNSVVFPGTYSTILGVSLMNGLTIDWVEKAIEIEVVNAPSNSIHHHAWPARGFIRTEANWTGFDNQ